MAGNPLLKGLVPMHPGELLREVTVPALAVPKAEIARRLGISRQTLYDILDEKQPVTPVMAPRLGKFLGNGLGAGWDGRLEVVDRAGGRETTLKVA